MRIIAGLLCAIALSGCQTLSSLYGKQDALYGPARLNTAATAPSVQAYRAALATNQAAYTAAMSTKSTPAELIDSGIAASNNLCRKWFDLVTATERRFRMDRDNRGVIEQVITGAMGLASASSAVVAAWGMGTGAYESFNSTFETGVLLTPSDPAVQAKIYEIMQARAGQMRAATYTFPAAYDAIEEYLGLCSYATAQAAIKSAMGATVATIAPSGAIQSVAR